MQHEILPRRLRDARRPSRTYELLNLSQIERRYGLHEQRVYVMVAQGLVHPVQPHGRILYPEWEIAAALGPLAQPYLPLFDFARLVKTAA